LIVVDTSALVDAVLARPVKPALVSRLSDDGDLHAPHLIDVEVLHALRRLGLANAVHDSRLEDARGDIADISMTRYPMGPLTDRAWELRHQLTAYDAMFIALAEALEVPLITCDRRLSRVGDHHAQVEVF
jgi:predicted nucleic acid-binding protein